MAWSGGGAAEEEAEGKEVLKTVEPVTRGRAYRVDSVATSVALPASAVASGLEVRTSDVGSTKARRGLRRPKG